MLGCLGLVGLPLGPLAVGLAIAARRRATDPSGLSTAALVIGVLSTLLLAAEIVLLIVLMVTVAHFNIACLETGGSCWR